MTDSQHTTDLHPTDEPDGATAYEASLRPPGHSVTDPEEPGSALSGEAVPDGGGVVDDASETDGRARYDADAVSGDTPAYRPDN
ncbi:hypothetical protein [Actinoplanes sp. N902-109]|uniref:hypothetical protein n=1 Tax=Actinoplanes sp. (strain N902-109) TaxID=649831 RepID=UPI0003294A6C|nr:hypothetical protein [Actinoplanes sp. N902-109]AGL18951.1 hypothetical protein L083_5441 [Actinoplanes sp. N902-109]